MFTYIFKYYINNMFIRFIVNVPIFVNYKIILNNYNIVLNDLYIGPNLIVQK